LEGGVSLPKGKQNKIEKKKEGKRTDMLAFQPLSKTAMAARLPEPMVTYGSLSVEPCGWMVKRCGPDASTPPSTSAAPIWPWYLRGRK
jgi:hypothetical protein